MTVQLREYQTRILNELKHLASIGLFMGTGTGKTITSLWRTGQNPTDKLLIICPYNVLEQWEDVIDTNFKQFKVLPFKKAWGSKCKNDEIMANPNYNTIIVNFEIFYKLTHLTEIIDNTWTIIIDESHRIKTMGSSRNPVRATRGALVLGKKTPWKIILTATPTQKGYEEYYPQLNFLGYLDITWGEFLNKYCVTEKKMYGNSKYPHKEIVGYQNTDELDKILKVCCRKYDAKFGDFEPQHTKINLERPKMYARVARERVYKELVLNNMSRKRIGLKTLCTGTIGGMDFYDTHYTYEDNTIKIDWLKEFLKDTDETVAIYYNYNVELHSLEKMLKEIGKTYITVNGATKNKYAEINDKEYEVMLGQFQAASESLDGLQHKCHIEIMFAMPESSLLYKQSLGRIDRDGQEHVPMYYYLVCKDTIEADIYDMIEKKIEFNEEVLNKLAMKGEK